MKSLFIALAMLCAVSTAEAAKEKKEFVKQSFVAEIDCESCLKKVMNILPYQKGIKDVKCDLATKCITVEYDESKSSDEAVIATLKKVDITATVCDKERDDSSCSSGGCCSNK